MQMLVHCRRELKRPWIPGDGESSRAILEEIDDARFGKELLKKTPVYIKEEENERDATENESQDKEETFEIKNKELKNKRPNQWFEK